MKRNIKKLISLSLASVMVMSTMPVVSFAGTDSQPEPAKVENQNKYSITERIKEETESMKSVPLKTEVKTAEQQTTINAVNFPDNNFRNLISKYDANRDGILAYSEIYGIEYLDVSNKNIKDLTGIKCFANLKSLNCNDNDLLSFDASNLTPLVTLNLEGNYNLKTVNLENCGALTNLYLPNVYFDGGYLNSKIESLNLKGCKSLVELDASYNMITDLDLTGCYALEKFLCDNNKLTEINLKGLTKLKLMNCTENDLLKTVDVSGCSSLTELKVPNGNYNYNENTTYKTNLQSLNISGCRFLGELDCSDNLIEVLNLDGCISLRKLDCSNNKITGINATGTALETLSCDGNDIRTMNLNNLRNLKQLNFHNNSGALETIDVRNCEKLMELKLSNSSQRGKLTSLDLSGCKSLETLYASNHNIKNIRINNLPALKDIRLDNNKIESLDFSGCTSLKEFTYLTGNPIKSLNFTNCTSLNNIIYLNTMNVKLDNVILNGCTSLENLNIHGHNLKTLNLKDCKNLITLICEDNKIAELDLTNSPKLSELDCSDNLLLKLDLSANPVLNSIDIGRNRIKNLSLGNVDKVEYLSCKDNGLTSFDVQTFPVLKELNLLDNPLKSLNLKKCGNLQRLTLGAEYKGNGINCDLNGLDLSECPVLNYLYCGNCNIDSLDVSKNKVLATLECNGNNLTTLNLNNNPELKSLTCSGNRLNDIDLSANKKLEYLNAGKNQLSYIDLSSNIYLKGFHCDFNNLAYVDLTNNPYVREVSCESTYLTDSYDIKDIKGFDEKRATVIRGGNFENGKLVFNYDPHTLLKEIVYDYDMGNGLTETFSIYYINDIKDAEPYLLLNNGKAAYTGNVITPKVNFKRNAGYYPEEGKDYKVTYSMGRVNPGRYSVTITGMGRYKGSVTKYFTIVPKAPAQVTTRLARGDGNDLYTYWTKVNGADGYNVYFRLQGNTAWTYAGETANLGFTKYNLLGGRTYQFKVVPFIKVNNTKYLSLGYRYNSATTLKKVNMPTVTRVNSSQVRVKWNNILAESGYQISRAKTKTGRYIAYTWRTTTGNNKLLKPARGTTYYYRVRAFRDVKINGKYERIYGMWSNARAYRLK